MRLICDELFDSSSTDDEAPSLVGGRHRSSGRIVFPCPGGADAALYERLPLSRSGKLWSWTVQRFRPKSPPYIGPEAFTPYAVGYVELPGQTIVESRLTGVDVEGAGLRIGMPVELALIEVARDHEGTPIMSYAFRPQQQESQESVA